MARTFKRQPYSVSTSGRSYAQSQSFVQAEFKGLSNIKNDTLVDQSSFASTENVYVDDNMLLVSRPPLKFYDGEGYIERDWLLGQYKLRLYRQTLDGEYVYTIRCISHNVSVPDGETDKLEEYVWRMPIDRVKPDVSCIAIEDKIFIWFGGFDLVVFNTAEKYFESGLKYLYLPILSLSVNGIETPVESANFLTPTGRRRHQYSLLSSVNFAALVGKTVDVNYNDTYLYSETIESHEPCLIRPALNTSIRYHYDVAQALETLVYLRYDEVTSTVEVSLDGKYFEMLPMLDDILGLPQLSRDGTCVSVLGERDSKYSIYYCKLFAENSGSTQLSHNLSWKENTKVSASRFYAVPRMCIIDSEQYAILYTASGFSSTSSTLSISFTDRSAGLLTYKLSNIKDILTNDVVVTARYIADAGFLVAIVGHNIGTMKFGLRWYFFTVDGGTITYTSKDYDIGSAFTQRYGLELTSSAAFDAVLTQHLINTSSTRVNLGVVFTDGRKDYELFIDATVDDDDVYTGGTTFWLRNDSPSSKFKYSSDLMSYITDKYLSKLLEYKHNIYSNLIQYPEKVLWPKISTRLERNIISGDTLSIVQSGQIVSGNIHRVAVDIPDDVNKNATLSLIDGPIMSGDFVVWKENTRTAEDYFTPDIIHLEPGNDTAQRLHLFTVEKLDETDPVLYPGDTVRLSAYPYRLRFVVEFDYSVQVEPWTYPAAPDGWTLGDPWPSASWPAELYPKPLDWQTLDPLPTGPVRFEGIAQHAQQIIPVATIEQNVWLQIDDELWTSLLGVNDSIEIDEYINTGISQSIKTNLPVPTHYAALGTYYFSFEDDGRHYLEVMQMTLDTRKLSTEGTREYLLYLPERNEQIFADKITNLRLIADNILAVFTADAIWNITASTRDDGSVVYSAPILSKVPAGCRDGDDVVMALDGQALLMATPRGIAALAPQDFVATADKVMTYLSDSIQDIYDKFYRENVRTSYKDAGEEARIKMLSYRYWLLLYRHMDRTILLLDTRTGVWWRWTTPYPIVQITTDLHLHLIMQVKHINGDSFGGVSYVLKDCDDTEFVGESNPTFLLPSSIKSKSGYNDDVIDNTLSGSIETVYENEFIGNRASKGLASPIIKWHILSQKLHLNAINNYKTIKGLVVALEGDDVIKTSLTLKVYRNLYHPEQNEVMQIAVNGLRTFNHRLNLLHAINFQYKLENAAEVEKEVPLKLSSMTIKYEVKEGIR